MQIKTTHSYSLFKPIGGNRQLNPLHIQRLVKSMKENYLFTVITVNERNEIIDGQHRFNVIKELNLPLHYVICKGYGLNEVHRMNQNSKVWNTDDYLDGYIQLGYRDYQIYKDFKIKYGFGHAETKSILLDISGSAIRESNNFYLGTFKIKDLKKATLIADKITTIGAYYTGYKRRSFVNAMIVLMKNESFDFDEFIRKVKIQPTALVDCTTTTNYIELIEDIYNFKRRDKINLRFSK